MHRVGTKPPERCSVPTPAGAGAPNMGGLAHSGHGARRPFCNSVDERGHQGGTGRKALGAGGGVRGGAQAAGPGAPGRASGPNGMDLGPLEL
eukprot:728314-Lingulodinium_polyedra.AAC.1